MRIDVYGRPDHAVAYQGPKPLAYIVKTEGTTIYRCFFDTNPRAIHRIREINGEIITDVAYGAWANRATLTYSPPGEYPRKVED